MQTDMTLAEKIRDQSNGINSNDWLEGSAISAMKSRTSIRSYEKGGIPQDKRDELLRWIQEMNKAVTSFRLVFMGSGAVEGNTDQGEKVGTYGIIRGARDYVVCLAKNNAEPSEIGYWFEIFILKCTEIGLGTCWLGGTFDRDMFRRNLPIQSDEEIAVVTPVGIPTKEPSLISRLMRMGAGANGRKPWKELFLDAGSGDGLAEDPKDPYYVPLEMVRWSPSTSNRQPWLLIRQGDTFHFFLNRTKGYGKLTRYDMQKNDLGIARLHFELACRELGLLGGWSTQESPPPLKGIFEKEQGPEYLFTWSKEMG